MSLSQKDRLERLERILSELTELNRETPVLVEGSRDLAALRELGLKGDILLVNTGRSLTDLMSGLAGGGRRLVILTDWDRKGRELFSRLSRLARAEDIKVVGDPWRRLGPLVRKDIQAVEDLPPLFRQLREKCRIA